MEFQERTEKPTGKRKAELRKKGNIARSIDFSNSLSFVIYIIILISFSDYIYKGFVKIFNHFYSIIGSKSINENILAGDFLKYFLILIVPMFVIFFVTSFFCYMIPSGIVFVKPSLKFNNLNIFANFKKIVSYNSLIESVKNIFKFLIIIVFLYSTLKLKIFDIFNTYSYDLMSSSVFNFSILKQLLIKIAIIAFIISIFDLGYRIYDYNKKSKMTKQEVKEEFKESEGNPQIKSKIRSLMRLFSKRNKLAEVKKASVVITNPTHYAVALKYSKGDNAPVLVAKGFDRMAFKIIDKAREHNVPVKRNPPLARAIFRTCQVGDEINPVFYRAVAEILAFLHKERNKRLFNN